MSDIEFIIINAEDYWNISEELLKNIIVNMIDDLKESGSIITYARCKAIEDFIKNYCPQKNNNFISNNHKIESVAILIIKDTNHCLPISLWTISNPPKDLIDRITRLYKLKAFI